MVSIAALNVYPVKSCRGIALDSAVVGPTGLAGDRQWLVVNENGRFLTQRELPKLALVVPAVVQGGIKLSAPGLPDLAVRAEEGGVARQVTIWNDRVDAHDAGEAAAQWFSQFLGRAVRLVRFAEESVRPSNRQWTGDIEALNLFSDGYPVLVLSLASLDDLNRRLAQPLPMNRFRPNIVLDGLEAYDEDRIHELTAGALTLRLVKPCMRCAITTTDQVAGEVSGAEPLKTLKAYRWSEQLRGVLFGQNAIIVGGVGSTLRVGQPVKIEWRKAT